MAIRCPLIRLHCTTQSRSMYPPFLNYARLPRRCHNNLSHALRMATEVSKTRRTGTMLLLAVS